MATADDDGDDIDISDGNDHITTDAKFDDDNDVEFTIPVHDLLV